MPYIFTLIFSIMILGVFAPAQAQDFNPQAFKNMSAEEKKERFKSLSPEQREAIKAKRGSVSEEDKKAKIKERMGSMSPEERKAKMKERMGSMSEEQKAKMREKMKNKRGQQGSKGNRGGFGGGSKSRFNR